MEDIIPCKRSPLLYHGDPGSQELGFYGGPQSTRSSAHHSHPCVGRLHVLLVDRVLRPLGQHLGIFSTFIHLASLLKYHQAVKSLASIRCIYVSVTVSLLPPPQSYLCPSGPLSCGVPM